MMEHTATIGDNHPPADQRILTLAPADEIQFLVANDIDRLMADATAILDTVSRIPTTISNTDVYGRVVTVVARLREIGADIDDTRKSHKQPYLDAGKKIDDLFKLGTPKDVMAKKIEGAVKDLSKRLSEHDTRTLREQQQQIDEERAAFAKALAADGLSISGTAPTAQIGSFTSRTGGMSLREVKRSWKVCDEAAVPPSVMSIDPKKVQALIDAGVRDIPGIQIDEEVVTTVKRR